MLAVYDIQQNNKLARYGTDGRTTPTVLLTAIFKVTWHKNWDKNKKSGPDKLWVLPPNLRIRGHLPAPIVNEERVGRWKCPNFRLSGARDLDLDLASGHTAYRHASSTSTYIPSVIEIEETFCGLTDGRTDGRADGHLRPTLLGLFGGVKLQI